MHCLFKLNLGPVFNHQIALKVGGGRLLFLYLITRTITCIDAQLFSKGQWLVLISFQFSLQINLKVPRY